MNILIKNAIVVTVDSNMNIIENACVAVEGSTIKFIGETDSSFCKSFKADKTIDANGRIVMPGIVNSHVHSPMTILR
ncbi:MAG: amidohydrolase, partial [Acidaminobacteraceae bacterium]